MIISVAVKGDSWGSTGQHSPAADWLRAGLGLPGDWVIRDERRRSAIASVGRRLGRGVSRSPSPQCQGARQAIYAHFRARRWAF